MKKTLILLAGYPATGKSDLTDRIIARHPAEDFAVTTPDEVKEQMWDEVGFDGAQDKARLELKIWERYYANLEGFFKQGRQVISDYPFSDKQKATLDTLTKEYGYQVVTVRLVGDPRVIYARSLKRDLSPRRHLGHLMNHYHRGDVLEDRTKADALVTLDVFLDRCAHKGYDRFCLGNLVEVDATDVSAIDYPPLLDQIDLYLTGETAAERMHRLAGGCALTDAELAARIDYTLLKPTATWPAVEALCAEAVRGGVASVCVAPSFVKRVHEAYPDLPVCTVVGFPLGYATTATKAAEAAGAVADGASEVDMVVNLGDVKARDFDAVTADIRAVREAVPDAVLKVIVETCYLAQEEKPELCRCVSEAGADFIKTSTGFGTSGAQVEDIALFRAYLDPRVKIKAAGGIRTRDALAAFATAGCDRIGCSTPLEKLFG